MANITWAGADLYMTDSIVVDYESGARRFYNIHDIPKTVWEWFKENRPKELKAIEIKKDPFGMVACMDSVEMYVETFGEDPFKMLKEYEQKAKEDIFFNKTMIEAVKQYIAENGLKQEEEEGAKEIKREHDANLIDVCSLLKEIRDRDPEALTDVGCICNYNGSTYVEDAFCEIAYSETSIYYSDIISYISEHVEEVSDTIDEMGWDNIGGDLYKAGQYTEYITVNNWLWGHSTDVYRVYALNYIRGTYGEKIERTVWERFDSELEQYGEFNKLGEIEQLVDMTVGEEDELTA